MIRYGKVASLGRKKLRVNQIVNCCFGASLNQARGLIRGNAGETKRDTKYIMKRNTSLVLCTAAILSLGVTSVVCADDENQSQSGSTHQYGTQPARQSSTSDSSMEVTAPGQPTRFNKASKLIGMSVQNEQGQSLGDIKDIVIDLEKGTVSYAVLSSGSVLGVGEKLLAVPLTAFTRSADEKHLILQASKDNISQAETIGNNWPSVQNPSFGAMPFWQQSGSVTNRTSDTTPPSR
jgi:sporulation protein YlmC with PRC-barrel domain